MYQLRSYQTSLVKRAREELSKGNKGVLLVAPPGSGKSVIIAEIARLATEKQGQVLFLVHRKELVEQITQSFKNNTVDMSRAIVMTVGKVVRRLARLPVPTVIITDETHHALAKTYRKIYDYYADVPRLGFTATPWRMSGQGFTDIYSTMVEGPTVDWLIKNQSLAPYKYFMPQSIVARDELKRSSQGDFTKQSIDEALEKTIFGDVVDNYRKLANGKQAILYAHSVEYSQMFAKQFADAGITANHIDATTPSCERAQIIQAFRNHEIKVLCNVDLISEGFDVPDVSVIMLLRPTKSLVLHIQQAMRGMRYQPNKTAIIIDQVANALEHGLPDTPRSWSLEGKPKDDAPRLITCDFCQGAFYKWAHDSDNRRVCPYCGEAPAIDEDSQKERDNDKEIVQDDMAEITDIHRFNQLMLAKKNPARSRNLSKIYDILVAQQETETRQVKWPVYRAMHLRLNQVKEIKPEELTELADRADDPLNKITATYERVKKKHEAEAALPTLFNF